ncbi:tetratricopeptide repeat protein [Variovorax paradoxus]|uniref:tetratricopeptide repeat protein n=1 Tax=Variovorax paradoxus TaxID=34073 RepID=UPI0029C71F08|nr:tetratricopeptide repeat protein [Variovorax paradoxus]
MQSSELNSFDALMSSAMAASQANDGPQAIDLFQQASAADPGAALPQFLLGAELAALGDMTQAEAAFANATRLAPGFPMARYQLGLLQFSSGRAAIALLTWQPLLDLPAADPLPHFVNGFAALAQDRFDEALRHYEQGLALNTTNEALSGDIEKVVAGIKALVESSAAVAPDAGTADDEASNHVLLANYHQQGRAH